MTLSACEKTKRPVKRTAESMHNDKRLLLHTIGLISAWYERAQVNITIGLQAPKLLLKQSQVLVQLKNLSNHDVLKLSSTCHEAFSELSRNWHIT